MEPDDEARLAIHDEPDIMPDPGSLHDRFVSMPLVGIKVEHRQEFKAYVVKKQGEAGAPTGDGSVRNPDVKGGSENEADVVVFKIVMKETGFATHRARGICPKKAH